MKRRLVEYLAVVQLLETQAQAQAKREVDARAAIEAEKKEDAAANKERALIKAGEGSTSPVSREISNALAAPRKRVAKGPILL